MDKKIGTSSQAPSTQIKAIKYCTNNSISASFSYKSFTKELRELDSRKRLIREVLRYVKEGFTNQEIAERLDISHSQVSYILERYAYSHPVLKANYGQGRRQKLITLLNQDEPELLKEMGLESYIWNLPGGFVGEVYVNG